MEKYKIEYENENNRNLKRGGSPDGELRLARTLNVISDDFGTNSSRAKREVQSSQKLRPSTHIGRHSDQRIKRRAISESSPLIGGVRKKKFIPDLDEAMNSGDDSIRIPNARLGAEVPISNKTSVLGSSQFAGCQGDFCSFDLSYLESKEVEDSISLMDKSSQSIDTTGLSDFRKRLLYSGSVSEHFINKSSNLGKLLSPPGEHRSELADDGSSITSRVSSAESVQRGTSLKKILFRSIIQARQEMPLVKAQLERHKKGEEGMYMRADSYLDTAVGGKLPSHYYQDVPCCLNCFKVYNIIDKARTKALKTLAREREERSDSSVYSRSGASLQGSLTRNQVDQLRSINSSSQRKVSDFTAASFESRSFSELNDNDKQSQEETMQAAIAAVDGLTKLDVAEIRSMAKPPAAVEVVMEAVMILLTGKPLPLKDLHRLLSGGEAFLLMLCEFDIGQVSDERLTLMESYVDNPLFRPENVAPVSLCASKFCAWVHGIVYAARYERGLSHPRIDPLRPKRDQHSSSKSRTSSFTGKQITNASRMPAVRGVDATPAEELSFVQKLEKMKAIKQREAPYPISRQTEPSLSSAPFSSGKGGGLGNASRGMTLRAVSRMDDSSVGGFSGTSTLSISRGSVSKFDPGPVPSMWQGDEDTVARSESPKKASKREAKAMRMSQKRSTDRLASQSVTEGAGGLVGGSKLFRCSDGITKMPFVVLGKFSLAITRCSFIVVHDFFDTCDATAILFKPIVQRHEGCQVMCFNYPGQANTVWPRVSLAERDRGAVEPVLNNDWIADRLHELLKHAEQEGDILLSCPFHLVGIGNGACIAAAFAQRYGNNKMYVNSLRSLVSINGFLYPDPQLSAILHSAYQVFESAPHSRPDIPVSYWSRFVFSEDYLKKVNPNLALNIYTAVSNPMTNEGRTKIAKGSLQHRDLRGALAPDYVATTTANKTKNSQSDKLYPLQIPIVLLQSTENTLVNASNVDSFLVGRNSKHLWSHMLNIPNEAALSQTADINAQWVGRMSSSPADYHKFSTLGKSGLKMLLECLRNPRGAFSMWTRTGHAVHQEYKASVLDLFDVLACPTDEYVGLDTSLDQINSQSWKDSVNVGGLDDSTLASASSEQRSLSALSEARPPPKVGVIFKIAPPKSNNREIHKEVEIVEEKSNEPKKTEIATPNKLNPTSPKAIQAPATPISISATITPSLPRHQIVNENDNVVMKKPSDDEISESNRTVLSISSLGASVDQQPTPIRRPMESKPVEKDLFESIDDSKSDISDASSIQQKDVSQRVEGKPRKSRVSAFARSKKLAVGFAGVDSSDDVSISIAVPSKPPSQPANVANNIEAKAPNPIAPKPSYPALPEVINVNVNPPPTEQRTQLQPPPMQPTLLSNPVQQSQIQPTTKKQHETKTETILPSSAPVQQQPRSTIRAGGPIHPKLLNNVKDGTEISFQSTEQQRTKNEWVPPSAIPDAATALELEAELKLKQKEYMELEAKLKKVREDNELARKNRIGEAQLSRRLKYEEEDRKLLEKLQAELDVRQRERDYAEKQRRIELRNIEKALVEKGIVPASADYNHSVDYNSLMEDVGTYLAPPLVQYSPAPTTVSVPVPEIEPRRYDNPPELPKILTESQDMVSKLDRMLEDEENARKRGTMTMEQYEAVKFKMAERQLERDQKLRQFSAEELKALFESCALVISKVGRGYIGRKRYKKLNEARDFKKKQSAMIVSIQKRVRGIFGRKRFKRIRNIYLENVRGFYSATLVQRIFRGYYARRHFRRIKRLHCAKLIQRVFRGHLGRKAVRKERSRLAALRRKQMAAAKIQSVWRMKVSREEFRGLRVHVLAATEIQRAYRGYLGRKKMLRRKQWESAKPGPERIKLGLQFIEESKLAFERQQEEIDALHRAQARAEARVSNIHAELKDSEKELLVLERELQEIDQIERDLSALTHERQLLVDGIQDATGIPKLAGKGRKDLVMGKESTKDDDPIADRRRKAEAYALEMTIQIKRAEREKKRQELEIEFAAVFQEVDKKKKALAKLELALTDMESTRERKDREFRRLQKNLMQLLLEQKKELDDLREKGIELETATATTAAAAIATAQKAKEHEKRSTAMFSQTEELMKFQFMSMSLSYFSSLNMLKSLRDMNADTTSAAIAMSADAAAAAAGAAAAANLPNVKKLNLGANDFIEASIQKKKAEIEKSEKAERELKIVSAQSLPENVRTWTVTDVSRWLDAMSLGQYCEGFVEASVDGPFLLELREEDLVQVLNIKHKLHVRKIIVNREKLKPLTMQEKRMQEAVEIEELADNTRKDMGVPSIDTVFSQARNGRVKRVEESLNLGFKIDSEDERGNTLLLLAAQNSNKRLAEMLIIRGANINHQNASGNTALHFALAFDAEGALGEYLIEHGADDSIENIDGLTPYDGVAA